MKRFSMLLVLFILLGCNEKGDPQPTDLKEAKEDDALITTKDIEKLTYTEFVLSADAQEAIVDWQRYQELMLQMDYLKQADLSFFSGKNELLVSFMKDLKKDMPMIIATPAIKERLIVLETKLLKFHSTLNLSNATNKEVLSNIKELLVAASNLHLQINKKFELESQVIEDPIARPEPID